MWAEWLSTLHPAIQNSKINYVKIVDTSCIPITQGRWRRHKYNKREFFCQNKAGLHPEKTHHSSHGKSHTRLQAMTISDDLSL